MASNKLKDRHGNKRLLLIDFSTILTIDGLKDLPDGGKPGEAPQPAITPPLITQYLPKKLNISQKLHDGDEEKPQNKHFRILSLTIQLFWGGFSTAFFHRGHRFSETNKTLPQWLMGNVVQQEQEDTE